MRITLRTRILLLVAATVTGLATVLLASITWFAGREVDRAVRRDVREAGAVLRQTLKERSTALQSECLVFIRQPAMKLYFPVVGPAGRSAALLDWATTSDAIREYLGEMGADAALVTDGAGKPLGYSALSSSHTHGAEDVKPGTPSSAAVEPGVAAALDGRNWSGVVERAGKLMQAVSLPVTLGAQVVGTFTAYRAVGAKEVAALKGILGCEIVFVRQGAVTYSSVPAPPRVRAPRSDPGLIQLDGRQYFALYAAFPNAESASGIGFITLLPAQKALAPSARLRSAALAVSGIGLVMALVAGALLSRGLTRPLEGVVRAAEIVRAGEWPEPIDVRRTDEIGLLQSVFNAMTSSLRDSRERLLALIDTDPLTELDNHRRFQERLLEECRRSAQTGLPLSLLLVDLDNFQQFNRERGHTAGDEALRAVSATVRAVIPDIAIPSRYGGEEIAVLLPGCTLEHAAGIAEDIREAIHVHTTSNVSPTVSIGCAEFGGHVAQAEGLPLAAEMAVSQAKQFGRDRVCRFDAVPGVDPSTDPLHLYRFLKDASIATIQALAAAVDAKDSYTQGHSQRVADYAKQLARYIGLSPSEIDLIYTTATLHDVGKIGVPDRILQKPGRLDDEERSVMETHPVLGEVIVRKAPQLAATLPGVRHHHERWDGKGYPDQIAGEAIPFIARLLAVADTYDAMTSDRPYRKGLDSGIALDEIARGAGVQFDPVIAQAFFEMISADEALPLAA